MNELSIHGVVSVVKETNKFNNFTTHNYIFTDSDGNKLTVKAFACGEVQFQTRPTRMVEDNDAQTVQTA